MAAVRDNKAQNRFELDVEGAVAFANYRVTPAAVVITHTETPRALRGRGIASELVKGALELIRADGRKVIAGCGFVVDYLRKNPEFADLTGDLHLSFRGDAKRRPGMTAASRNPDRHIRQAFELAQQHVALHDRADIFRGAGIDDVAGLEFERLRQF